MSKVSNVTNLNDVKPFKTSWKVCVKVVHTWKQYTTYAGETLEMILADQEGTLIHGTVKKQQIIKFQRDVKYGQWIQIEHFMLSRSSGNYRATRHPYKMTIMNTSVFTMANHISDDMYIDLVSFADIAKPEYPTNILIDVIGQILDVGALKTMTVKGKPVKKIEFELRNTRNERLKCTVWAKWADLVYSASDGAGEDPIICVLRFGKINEWQGERSISSSFETSLVLINPDYPCVEEFKIELPKDGLTLAVIPEKPKESSNEIKKSMYLALPTMSISELLESNDVMKCKIFCEVWAIDTDYSWYIFGCIKCNKSTYKVPKNENEKVSKTKKSLFWCPSCQIETTKVSPRYQLWLNGRDKTGDTKFLLFDKTVKNMCKIDASEILNGEMEEIQDPTQLPIQIENLINREYEFVVEIQKENIQNGRDFYKVLTELTNEFVEDDDQTNDSETTHDPSQVLCIDQTSQTSESDHSPKTASTTPSSKRIVIVSDTLADHSSTNKRICLPSITMDLQQQKVKVENEKVSMQKE